ncbi:MAG: hypothetical protein JST00_03050 [Deltaproteobacteria bacterium]|nr:hypothetical protein [Deltaproteobacteria bacterium]
MAVSTKLMLARRRARRRRDSAGAAMFIVAVTLGLLAVMGLYGLTATAADIRAAGHTRETLQAQKTAEHAMVVTAELLTPSRAKEIYEAMYGNGDANTKNCLSTPAFTGAADRRDAEACRRLTLGELAQYSNMTRPPFTPKSFGDVQNNATTVGGDGVALGGSTSNTVQVELSNPIDVPIVGSTTEKKVQVTITVYATLRPTATQPPQTVMTGRGRLTIGPVSNKKVQQFP